MQRKNSSKSFSEILSTSMHLCSFPVSIYSQQRLLSQHSSGRGADHLRSILLWILLWPINSALGPWMTSKNTQRAFRDADGNTVFQYRLPTIFRAGRIKRTKPQRIHRLHRSVVKRKGSLIQNNRCRCDFPNHQCSRHNNFARCSVLRSFASFWR